MIHCLRTLEDEDSNNIFLGILVVEDLRKLLGVVQVRHKGNMMLRMFMFMHVLYVEDWNKKVRLPIYLRISAENRNKFKFRLAFFEVSWALLMLSG